MTGKFLVPFALIYFLAISLQAQENSTDHPLTNDPTGINWVFSLDEAIETAKQKNRIVILKPVDYRSKVDSDQLSPSSEAQRALSLVDSRVVNLLNRRFVPYYFDIDPLGSEYDERASTLTQELYPEMRYLSSMPTPPLIFMSPEGKMLGHASNFLTAQELLDRLGGILVENPSFMELTTEEKVIDDPVQKAWLLYELRQLDEALALLDKKLSSECYYLQVLIAREQQNWIAMKEAIRSVTDTHRKLDIEVENVIRYWVMGNYEGIKAKGQLIGTHNPRYQEAMYYLGLAWYHTGDKNKALETWLKAIESNPKSAWAFRLDLTQGLVKLNPEQYLSAQDLIPSELDRKYMCPNGNDDLAKKKP